jgi:hypothetical protein
MNVYITITVIISIIVLYYVKLYLIILLERVSFIVNKTIHLFVCLYFVHTFVQLIYITMQDNLIQSSPINNEIIGRHEIFPL